MSTASYANTPDFNPEDEASIKNALTGEFTRPAAVFQGRPLWPFTPGSKALYHMSLSDADTRLYRVLAFILIHIRGEQELRNATGEVVAKAMATSMESDLAARVVPLVWHDLNLFRVKALALCDSMTPEDIEAAFEIVNRELKLEAASEVVATPPDYGAPQKKSTPTPRPKSGGKRSRPRKK